MKIKKVLLFLLAAMFSFSSCVFAVSAAGTEKTVQRASMDGQEITLSAYQQDGTTYYRLRDLAAALCGTYSKFGVSYDSATNSVVLTTFADYTPGANDLKGVVAATKAVETSKQSFKLDGADLTISAILVDEENYVPADAVASALGFQVSEQDAQVQIASLKTGEELYAQAQVLKALGRNDSNSVLTIAAAEAGYASAYGIVAETYMMGYNGIVRDYAKALTFAQQAAEDDINANFTLGVIYLNGYEVVEPDGEKAVMYLQKATDAGYKKAARFLGQTYQLGLAGVTVDYEKAVHYYEVGMQLDDHTCHYFIGQMYEAGIYFEQDYQKAMEEYLYFCEHAHDGAPQSAYAIGRLYENGFGMTADVDTAIEWYGKSAVGGYQDAIDALIRLGVPYSA